MTGFKDGQGSCGDFASLTGFKNTQGSFGGAVLL